MPSLCIHIFPTSLIIREFKRTYKANFLMIVVVFEKENLLVSFSPRAADVEVQIGHKFIVTCGIPRHRKLLL